MFLKEYHISPEEINIRLAVIAKLLGLEAGNIPEPYASIIDTEMQMIGSYNQIRGGIRIVEKIDLDFENDSMILEDTSFSVGKQVIRYLRNSEKIALFLCTAGENVSLRSKELMNSGDLLEGYVCDVIGSVMVEEAMSIIYNRFVEDQKNGISTTNRYSPGYCDWHVSEQHKLFRFFPEGFCGITLSKTSLMHPVKSVSGAFGIGEKVRYHKYVCNACSNVNCIYRNLKYTV